MKTFSSHVSTEQPFDRRMRWFLRRLHQQPISRRHFLRSSVAGIALGVAGNRAVPPGLSVLAQTGTAVTFGLEEDPAGLEPALSYDQTTSPVVNQISEPLVTMAADGSVDGLLVASFERPDLQTYIYRLRDGLTFHDGSRVTADDVIASIARIRDPRVDSPLAWMYDGVGAIVDRTDDMTVTIRLAQPSFTFTYVAATSAGHVIPKAAIEDPNRDLARNPIGTGPYRFVEWQSGSEITLEKNPTYWQRGKPHFDRLTFKIVPQATTRVIGLKTGEIDLTTGLSGDDLQLVQQMPDITIEEADGYSINYVALRMDQPPFDDINVRKAVNYAVDVESIIANIVGSTGTRAHNTPVPPTMPGSASSELTSIPYDLDNARQLLAASPFPNGFTTHLTILASNDVISAEALKIQQDLKHLNIDVEIVPLPFAEYTDLQTARSYDGMLHVFWSSDFPDAAGLLIPQFHSRNIPVSNFAYYANSHVDELLDESEREPDPVKRMALLKKVQYLVSEDQPYIFIDHFKSFMPMSSNLTGYSLSPMWMWDCFGRDLRPEDRGQGSEVS